MKHYGDITKLSGRELPPVDIITGGSPCQDLSVAGNRAGLSGERSGLFMEQIRIVKEMRDECRRTSGGDPADIKPRFMVWENVQGAFSSNSGKDFQAVLTEIVRIVKTDAPDVPLPNQDASWVTETTEFLFPSHTDYTMPSFGESPSAAVESHLSQILEEHALPKYYLSAKACQGILNRAAKREKELPELLKKALTDQIARSQRSDT